MERPCTASLEPRSPKLPILLVALVIVITTIRHEGSHALAAWLTGVPVHEVRLLPGVHPERGFYFGYVSRGDGGGWFIDAAPFIAALLWCLAALAVLRRVRSPSRLRFPLILLGIISPIADLAYNYQGGFWRPGTDVHDLLIVLPDVVVHVYFVVAIGVCAAGLMWARRGPAESQAVEPGST